MDVPVVRVLFTGPRTWTDPSMPVRILNTLGAQCCGRYKLAVMHGQCRTGLDRIVANWVEAWGDPQWVDQEPYPAGWGTGRRVGAVRNQEMVSRGPLLTVGFVRVTPQDASSGALGCLELSRKAGIPTIRVDWDDMERPYFSLVSRDRDGLEPFFILTEHAAEQ